MAKPPKFADTQPDLGHNRRTGKGMPARKPQDGSAQVDKAQTPKNAAEEASLQLPHERDQSTDMTNDKPDPAIRQAKRDMDSGQQDTGKSPEMNRAYNKQK